MFHWLKSLFRRPSQDAAEVSRLMESVEWPTVAIDAAAYAEDRAEIAENNLWMAHELEKPEARAEKC